ncbi:MAG: PIN domain-containing protein, partial [Candidatus Heimdallarchaeaceae archaeon]
MQKYVVDTNFFISGFQVLPTTFSQFAKILKSLKIEIYIPTHVKNELRFFVQREIIPYVQVEDVKEQEFQKFLRKLSDLTTSLPQKPDLAVIFLAQMIGAKIVSSDLKLLETAELIGLSTLTDSAFARYIIEENRDEKSTSFLKDLESKLFTAEIRYSVESTNRYDPVKRIRKILDSAISVIRTEYEEKLSKAPSADIEAIDGFSIESLQLNELLIEIHSDLKQLEEDFVSGKYLELEGELLSRVQEITDHLIDWKLVIDNIEDHSTYGESLLLLGRLQY